MSPGHDHPLPPKPLLRGRGDEESVLLRLLDDARDGRGGALLLTGGAGIGKTALLDLAVARATPGFLVLRVSGVAAESRLPYAGLHGLLGPIAEEVGTLPEGQVRALREALECGTTAPGLVLPAAVLGLLSAVAAGGRPVLACVDDVDHLDPASRDALAFAARRLGRARVALLFAARSPSGLDGVPARAVEGLGQEAVRELAADLTPERRLPEDLVAALDAVARGNPLALTELIGSLTPDQLAGVAAPPTTLPRSGRLWREHAALLAALPRETRRLLLLIAADPALDVAALLRAARPACALTALEPAEQAGVLQADGDRYAFRDPAVRAVAYQDASLSERRHAHHLLATMLTEPPPRRRRPGQAAARPEAAGDSPGKRLRRAWHRSWALDAPAARLADDLAAAALAARPLDDHPEPYLALERAADLTAHPTLKAERLAAAAHHAWTAGRPQAARSLLARLRALTAPGVTAPDELRGRVQFLRGSLELLGGETGSAREELLAAAGRLLDGEQRMLGVRALVRAADASYRAGDNRAFIAIARHAAALRRPDESAPTELMFEYLAGMAATFSGSHEEAAGPLRRVVELAGAVRDPSVLVWACVASMLLGEDAIAHRLSARAVESARVRGVASAIPQLLEYMIYPDYWTGRYASLAETAARGLRLAQETGQLNTAAQHLAWLAITAAVEGDQETCRVRADAAIDLADAHDLGLAGAIGNWALAYLDLAAGRPADAAQRLRAERRNSHVVIRVMATPHLIEACARTGDRERASAALRVLERWVGSTRSPDLRALVARCRALLAPAGEGDELFLEALELHGQGLCEFETARTRLLYGSALRRERRPGAARNHLHAALETFERYGARLWTDQARAELRASGDTTRPTAAAPGTAAPLTAQQLQIARMVAGGATNKEIAEQLFLSRRTVEHHLRNIFSRLGVRSRVELTRLFIS
ncbi:LuxR C-terminal-related transcriptional regulator [Nonomuraea wenchangensis]|uniref:LuxR C-terminal-related transcriptional regulator n=1 Tax=Nonomuraea wenchangensis TaxID=568860 RepID=UPI00371D409E